MHEEGTVYLASEKLLRRRFFGTVAATMEPSCTPC